ncbi:MAG: CDP-alcohol phosphatidyltransferase family protein, partial [Anaerolineae bacterium]
MRAPAALLFLSENVFLRLFAIGLAMITDSLDGYLARRSRTVTQFGAVFDPAMDKLFVFFTLAVLLFEGKVEAWQACSMISRDFFLIVFGLYLGLSGNWHAYQCK